MGHSRARENHQAKRKRRIREMKRLAAKTASQHSASPPKIVQKSTK